MGIMQDTEQYRTLASALADVDAETSAAGAQGMLCGMLSTPGETEQARWIAEVLANTEPKGEPAKACLQSLTELYDGTRKAFGDDGMSFAPLLPDDDAPLSERAGALGAWCEGFVFGLGLGGLGSRSELPRDAGEVVNDFSEIARVDTESDMGDEGEAAYAELVEYVRTGALLVRETLLAPSRAAPPGADSADFLASEQEPGHQDGGE